MKSKKLRNKYIEPICIIGLSMTFAFGVLFGVNEVMGVKTTTISGNPAEEYYCEGKYEQAISEYTKLQERDKWPIYKVKSAEIYSIQGKLNESNNLLKEAMLDENNLLASDPEKYLEADKELVNEVIFTFFMNKEYEQALSLGEYYLEEYNTYKPLLKTMFTIYLAQGDKESAKEILKNYEVNPESSYDLAVYSKMEIVLGNYYDGLENLGRAYSLNNNEIKVFDVITETAKYNKDELLESLNALAEENENEVSYKLFLAKTYLQDESTKTNASDILKDLDKNTDNINIALMKLDLDTASYSKDKWNDMVDQLIDSENSAYIGHYLKAYTYYNEGHYDKALEEAKKSVLINEDYEKNYGILIPKIMFALGKVDNVEGYFRNSLFVEPFNYNVMVTIGNYYGETVGDYSKAEEYYNIALKIKPQEADIYYDLAKLQLLNDDYEDSIPFLEKAISIDKTNGNYYRTLGTIYYNMKENEKALENIQEAYNINDKDILALNNAGCYYMLVDNDIWRGFSNIESAYEEMPADINAEAKALITDNYTKAKEVYDKFVEDEVAPVVMPSLKLSY